MGSSLILNFTAMRLAIFQFLPRTRTAYSSYKVIYKILSSILYFLLPSIRFNRTGLKGLNESCHVPLRTSSYRMSGLTIPCSSLQH